MTKLYKFEVTQDYGTPDPIAERGVEVEYYVVNAGYRSTASEPRGEFSRVFDRMVNESSHPKGVRSYEERALSTFRRWLVVFHGWSESEAEDRVGLFSSSGDSPREWCELFVIVAEAGYGTAGSWAEEWSMWANGQVYYVEAFERIECDSDECHGDEDSHWVEYDSMGGIYARDEDAAIAYFEEYYL